MVALSDTPVIRTDRLVLRAPTASDWPLWRDFYLSERARFVGGGPTVTPELAWRTFGHVIGHWVLRGFGMFVFATPAGHALGSVGPWFPEGWPEHEIGWNVWSAEAEGKGYAFEAAQAARDFARNTLGWSEMVSYIHPDNTRSIALANRLGAWRDEQAALPDAVGEGQVWRHPADRS